MLGVELGVIALVGNSTLINVSMGIGVKVGMLEGGVSSTGEGVDVVISIVCDEGRLQDDTPMTAAMTDTQR
jgi:hypothetical protein